MKPIEDIEVGDKVLAYDQHTGKQAYKKVTRLFRNKTDKWYHVHVNEQDIVCTAGHPFYVADIDEFVPAKDIKAGQHVLLADGSCAVIDGILVEELGKPETTYNFEVEDYHTYYVSKDKVLVHNMCEPDSPVKLSNRDISKFNAHDLKMEEFGKRAKIAHYDIYKDTAHGNAIWFRDKSRNVWVETGYVLSELPILFPLGG